MRVSVSILKTGPGNPDLEFHFMTSESNSGNSIRIKFDHKNAVPLSRCGSLLTSNKPQRSLNNSKINFNIIRIVILQHARYPFIVIMNKQSIAISTSPVAKLKLRIRGRKAARWSFPDRQNDSKNKTEARSSLTLSCLNHWMRKKSSFEWIWIL